MIVMRISHFFIETENMLIVDFLRPPERPDFFFVSHTIFCIHYQSFCIFRNDINNSNKHQIQWHVLVSKVYEFPNLQACERWGRKNKIVYCLFSRPFYYITSAVSNFFITAPP